MGDPNMIENLQFFPYFFNIYLISITRSCKATVNVSVTRNTQIHQEVLISTTLQIEVDFIRAQVKRLDMEMVQIQESSFSERVLQRGRQ